MRDLSKLSMLRDLEAERRQIVSRFGVKLAGELFGVYSDSSPIEPIKVETVQKPIGQKLDLDAVETIKALTGVSTAEARKQVSEAQQIKPKACTQEIVIMCLNGH